MWKSFFSSSNITHMHPQTPAKCPYELVNRDSPSLLTYYTVNHKKRATLFFITLAFLGRFLNILYQQKQEGILYKKLIKFTTSP